MTWCPSHVRLGYKSLASSPWSLGKLALRIPTHHIERRKQRLRLPCILGGTQATSQGRLWKMRCHAERAWERDREGEGEGYALRSPMCECGGYPGSGFSSPATLQLKPQKAEMGHPVKTSANSWLPQTAEKTKSLVEATELQDSLLSGNWWLEKADYNRLRIK